MRFAGFLWLLVGLAPLAHAQFFDFLDDWVRNPPSDTRAFSAQITSTLKAASPWGEINTIETGQYWRNSKGQDRFDDSHGLSEIRDRSGPVIRARIDRELRLVDVQEDVVEHAPISSRLAWLTLPFRFKVSGQRTVEGLKATVRSGDDHGVSYEVWTSDELGIVVYAKYKTDHTVFEQRIHDIRFAEPDPAAVSFSVPSGFRTHITCTSISEAEHEAPRQTYEPGRDLCK